MITMNNLLRLLAPRESESNGADKITNMGADRREKVKQIISRGITDGSSEATIVKRLSRGANTRKKKDKRNWQRVARTEVWDAINRSSLDLIIETLGPKTKVVRTTSPTGNIQCKEFGCVKKRVFTAGDVPENLRGSVHVNCNCGPWTAQSFPELTKSKKPDVLASHDIPIGFCRRVERKAKTQVEISTGNGYWVPIESLNAKSILRIVTLSVPYVVIGEWSGYTVMRHGCGKSVTRYGIVSPSTVGSAQFYPGNPEHHEGQQGREFRMTMKKDQDEYLTEILRVLPIVAGMPEYWENAGLRHISDFFGYKTLTDWWVLVPGDLEKHQILAWLKPSLTSVRRAVRLTTRYLLEGIGEKKKCGRWIPGYSTLKE